MKIDKIRELNDKALLDIKEVENIIEIKAKLDRLNKIKVKYLGKKSEIIEIQKLLKEVSIEEKKELGKEINIFKNSIEKLILDKILELEKQELEERLLKEKLDLTLPVSSFLGTKHPIEKVTEELMQVFEEMGYEVIDGPEIEKTEYIFDMLNTPKDHPARELQDTFYLNDEIVLRSQTSAIQIRKMLEGELPIKMICPGRVYRSDSVDATHSPVFNQLEGLVVGENITMSDLKGTLEIFVKKILGEDVQIRFRPHHFPYTEPSAEVDVTCFVCKGKGCSVCKREGYIELLGCGMVHKKVLENCGIDSNKYSGFAFGFGIDRITMAKYGITDLRLLYENNVKFLNQFN